MHDQAIEARTRLQLDRATEQQAQDLENYKLDCQLARATKRRTEQVLRERAKGLPTVPSRLEEELRTNSFLRVQSLEIRNALGLEKASDLEVFTEIRRRKDDF